MGATHVVHRLDLEITAEDEWEGLDHLKDLLRKSLEKVGITLELQNTILICGIYGKRKHMETLLSEGIAGRKNDTFALKFDEIEDDHRSNPFGYADHKGENALVIYDGKKLTKVEKGQCLYAPIDGVSFRDALLAIVKLNFTGK